MKISEEQIKLANDFNKLYSQIKKGGDYAFDSVNEVKQEMMNNHGELFAGVLGFLADLHMRNPNLEVVFVPSETGVNVRYTLVEEINFNQQGNMKKVSYRSVNESERENI